MQSRLNKLIIVLALAMTVSLYPSSAFAADFSFNINLLRQDGVTSSELWLNDKLIWRVALLADGAKPVTGGFSGTNTTFVIPDIVYGMFVVKVE